MSYIRSVKALEILDSRGMPTIKVLLTTDQGIIAEACVPSGASTGENEALELRDGDQERYFGKGVATAVAHVNGPIAQILIGEHVFDQERIDQMLCKSDGTENKGRLGANAILGASLALARAGALTANLPLYRYIGGAHPHILPCPMINIINGGMHADNGIQFQEFMIRPIGASSFKEGLRMASETFQMLKKILKEKKLSTGVGDEGGFAPMLKSNEEALDLILLAIEKAGYKPKDQISLAIDAAASSFYDKGTKRYHERTSDQMIDYLCELVDQYPIDSVEDGLDENDWEGWKKLTAKLGHKIQIVGDDILVTNPRFIKKAFEQKVGNSVLIKCNQIGTLTETLEAIRLTLTHGYTAVVSHRSGETEDSFIADIAVGCNTGQIKTGSVCRTERIVKYNRLLSIEAGLGTSALYADSNPFSFKKRGKIKL